MAEHNPKVRESQDASLDRQLQLQNVTDAVDQGVNPASWSGGRLKDPRQEKLAHLLAEESDIPPFPDMAERAGYSTSKRQASYFRRNVLSNPDIQIRVLQLKGDATPLPEGMGIRDEVLESLRNTRGKAARDRDWTAVNRANELIGKSTGMFTDVVRHADPFEDMGPDELERTVAGLLKDPIVRGMVERALKRYQDEIDASVTKH